MRRIVSLALLCLAATASAADPKATPQATPKATQAKPPPPPPATAAPAPAKPDANLALNFIGLTIAKSLEGFQFSPAESDKIMAGLREGLSGKPSKQKLDEKSQENLRNFMQARMAELAGKEKTKGAAYLAQAEKEKGAVKTASGAIVVPIKEGSGAVPQATDRVKVHYIGTLVGGKKFDASRDHGDQPAEFQLNQVVKCWTEALQKMKVGGHAKVVCPSDIAYGEQGRPPTIPGNAVLTFDIELLDAKAAPPPPPPPPATPATPATPAK
jgi:FKBP-type peptidyl-prolyl cis-trans isomerase